MEGKIDRMLKSNAQIAPGHRNFSEPNEHRRADPRSRLVLRTGRITTANEISLCLVVNISNSGAMIRTYLPIDVGDEVKVELADHISLSGEVIWRDGDKAGLRFFEKVDCMFLLFELSRQSKLPNNRSLRIECDSRVLISSEGSMASAHLRNVSLRGGRIETAKVLRVGQLLEICKGGVSIPAAVRWVRDSLVGIQFLHAITVEKLRALSAR